MLHLPHRLLQETVPKLKKNRYIFILIGQICVFAYIIVLCVNIKAVIYGGLQVNNNSLKGSHG